MVDNLSHQPQRQSKAREILNGLSGHRIDPSTIKMIDSESYKKGGQGNIFSGTRIVPEEVASLVPEEYLKMILEMKLAIHKLEWNREDAEASAKFFNSFVNELSLMATLNHPNVITLTGFVENMEEGAAWLIIPWVANGNVREFLASGEWDIPERVSLIQDTVNGLEYLHTRQPPICHGDLKSMNILVNASYRAVITDFGSARAKGTVDAAEETDIHSELPAISIDDIVQKLTSPTIKFNPSTLELTLTGPGFTLRWTAPEVLNSGVQDLPSDMWSIGWVCWEIFTGKIPFETLRADSAVISNVIRGILPAIREEAHLSQVPQICSLMTDCWMSNPVERIDVSTFRRKVRFVPSITPSEDRSGRSKVRSTNLLLELGRTYGLQNNTVMAESHFQSAIEVATQTKDDGARANALNGLGGVYNAQSRYPEAEKAFREAHDIHSRIGSERGAADALNGLGEVYGGQSRYREAEKAFKEAHEIHSRIDNDNGAADALNGLGEVYGGQSRYREAEKAFKEVHDIHSLIANGIGAADALNGLGGVYSDQSRYREAEKAFMEAREIYSRIGYERGAADARTGLGGVYSDQSRCREAETAFMEAHEIHSRIGNERGAADALNGLGGVYSTQSRYPEAEKAFMEAHKIHARIGNERGAADALNGLGGVYGGQSRYREAEKAFREAHGIHSRIGSEHGAADALTGLGGIYHAHLRDSKAEKALGEAHDIHSRIGNERGAADALNGLGKVYSAQSRDSEAEKAFGEAHEIHSRIGNDLGVGNASNGLGGIYDAQSRDSEAERAYIEAHKIHSRIGTCIGTATALIGLGDIYDAQSRDSEAEQAYRDAQEILSRIEALKAANMPNDPEDTFDAEPCDLEDEKALREAPETHPCAPTEARTWNEQEDEEQSREILRAKPRILYEIGTTPTTSSFDDGSSASNDSESGSLPVPSTPVYKATEASLPEPSSPPCSPQTSATSHDTPYLLQLSSRRTYQASASPQVASVADPAVNDDQQEGFLTEQFATINYVPGSAAEELADLIQALGRAAPQAVRNKHKIYSVLRATHDTCNYILETGTFSGGQTDNDVKQLLERMEQYYVVLYALEETLLGFAEILPSEITIFGPELYSSWLQSRSMIIAILNKLCHPPFPEIFYKTHDIAEDSFFDDCSWLSRLLCSGIDAEVTVQFADPPMAHPVLAVTNGLHYMESQMKYGEQTRELVLDISTLLAQALAAASTDDDNELRQGEPFPRPVADRDWLIQALADSFKILDLDTTLEPPTAQELASRWTDIKTSFTSRGLSGLEKMI